MNLNSRFHLVIPASGTGSRFGSTNPKQYSLMVNGKTILDTVLEIFINNGNFDKIIVYDFKLGDGGIGDYLKFFMIILTKCMCNNTKFYCKKNKLVFV